jgi:ribonuclease P/MRP protein subunit RPP1
MARPAAVARLKISRYDQLQSLAKGFAIDWCECCRLEVLSLNYETIISGGEHETLLEDPRHMMATKMLYDLNVAWSADTTADATDGMLGFASTLGYSVVALNHHISAPPPSQIVNPLPVVSRSVPTVLRRVTVSFSDPATNLRLSALAAAYDLVAVRPTTEKAFAACCTTMSSTDFSIISMDLSAFLSFHFHPRTTMAAVARGLRFEICYGQAIGATGVEGQRARANFISNVTGLLRATKGRGIVLSSEARSALGLRAPPDVINLLAVWGLGTEKGMEALGVNPRGVVVNEGIARRGFRGVIDIIQGAAREEDETAPSDGRSEGKAKAAGKKNQVKDRQDAVPDGRTGHKRRPDEAENPPTAALSKRQAKKMRLGRR